MGDRNSNFSLVESSPEMQFYPNLRFPSNEISFKISDCTLQKEDDMGEAFNFISNLTTLKFNSVSSNEEISVLCEEKNRYDNGFFIAGEGGPVNITVAGDFNVITKGEILLIRHSNCPTPNIAIHELLHVLGFKHSLNKDNILYNITECDQTLSEDIIGLIDKLYSFPNYADLIIKNVSGKIDGRFLDINFSLINGGFKTAGASKVLIYSDDRIIDEIEIPSIEIGYGRSVYSENIWVSEINTEKLVLKIETNFNELDKENNFIELYLVK